METSKRVCTRWHLEDYVAIGLLVLVLVALLVGCAQ